ncbi:MAG TPA: hypothetical protein VMH27_08700 [Puia sp.]|nr:hypothetical protein [Puia sp.]
MNHVFYLSGGLGKSSGLGDCIYSLPVVKAIGGGIFVYGGARRSYELLKPLLEVQPYIESCKHVSEIDLPRDFVNLDLFRNSPLQSTGHLVNAFLDFFGFDYYDFDNDGPWLENIQAPLASYLSECTILNITPRYRDKIFPKAGGWDKEIHHIARIATPFFLGTRAEYEDAQSDIQAMRWVSHLPTENLLDAAKVIKGAKMFSGTQSSLLAIRQGLGLPYRFEQSPNHVDVRQFSGHETVINPTTRKLHLAYATFRRLLNRRA